MDMHKKREMRRQKSEIKEKRQDNSVKVNWFPGHMTKASRQIEDKLKYVDIVAEIIDARIPISSRNPKLDSIIKNKPRLIILNKCDMADSNKTNLWIEHFKKQGIKSIALDCKTGRGVNNFAPAVREVISDKLEVAKNKGIVNYTIKVMVVGIPNVGKSSFINKITKKQRAKTEDRPGVTRGLNWFTVDKYFEILDTPGVLWPKFEDVEVGEKLAFTGAVKDDLMDVESLAVRLCEVLKMNKTTQFIERFKLQGVDLDELSPYELLEVMGKKRGMLMSGGVVDTMRLSVVLLDEYRGAKLGKNTLEMPPT